MILSSARRAIASKRLTTPQTTPAPLLGWNTRDPFEAMEPTDAILVDNWYPDFGGVNIRNGSLPYAQLPTSANVETLAEFSTGAISKFLAASGSAIYDISNPGIPGTPIGTGFASDRWQTAEFNGHLFLVNGADPAQIYDGTTLSAASFTGINTATLTGVAVVHERLFFWTGTDPAFWYGPTLGIAGPLSKFPLDMESQAGGNLMFVEVFSYDGGQGIDSYTCFFLTSGELFLYSCTDPSNPNNWALVGRYVLPPPVNIRAILRYGGDIYLATQSDHQQLSKILIALKLGETPPRTKVSGAAKAAYEAGATLFGWQAIYYPAGTRLIFNIPNPDGSFSQHVYNTSVQAWCRFRGMNASCWGLFKGDLYFGTAGAVLIADTGSTDSGQSIVAASQQAWQRFGTPLTKRLAASRIIVQTDNPLQSYLFEVGFDWRPLNIITPISGPSIGATWGTAVWGEFNWAENLVEMNWQIQGGKGSAISWGIVANSTTPTTWISTDVLIEPGTAL